MVVEAARGRVPVVAGVASTTTAGAVGQAREYQALGCDDILAILEAYFPLSDEMLGNIIRLQLNRIKKRVAENHKAEFSYSDEVVKLIGSRCTEIESGGRMIDAILTNTILPRLSEGVWIAQPYIEGHYDRANGIRITGGHIDLPEGPGLGVVPDESLFGAPVASYA